MKNKLLVIMIVALMAGCETVPDPSAEDICVSRGAKYGTLQFDQCVAITRLYIIQGHESYRRSMDEFNRQEFPQRTVCSDDGMGGMVCVTR